MKFGFCTGIENYYELVRIGYDYIELAGMSIYKMSDDEFLKCKNIIDNGPIKCENINAFLLPEIKVLGDQVDEKKLIEYVKKVVYRAHLLRAKAICFGSPSSRIIPDGYSKEKAYQQALSFVEMTMGVAEPYGIRILIEALGKYETNFINNIEEAYDFIKQIKQKNVGLVLDLYHFWREGEILETLNSEIIRQVEHMHIADEDGRVSLKREKYEKYEKYMNSIVDLGYKGNISYEGVVKNFYTEALETLELLKEIHEK